MTSSIKKLLLLLLLNLSSWMILLASLSTTAAAFVGIPSSASSLPQRFVSTTATQPTHSRLAVISHPAGSTPSSSSSENMSSSSKDGLSLGKKLEGGQVIDFSSVKASSTAEKALSEARKLFLEHGSGGANSFTTTTTVSHDGTAVLLGINQDVVDQVGHSLGTFATPAEIQACARYLRSRAPAHLFSSSLSSHSSELAIVVDDKNSFGPHDIAKFQKILHNAYYESGEVTAAFAKTFYMGTMLLGENARKAIWAIYVWCRRTDEIVDAPRDNDADMLRDLSSWEIRLEDLWEKGQVVDVYDLCLLDVRINYPCLNIQPFLDMIRGMLMDVPGLGQERYETFDELHLYCYRVAGTVGVMSLPIFGCAPGFNDDRAR
jgi:phytoene synthase